MKRELKLPAFLGVGIILTSCGQVKPNAPVAGEEMPSWMMPDEYMIAPIADYSHTEESLQVIQSYFSKLAKKYPDGLSCLSGYSDSAKKDMYKYRYNPGKFQDAIKLLCNEGKSDKVVGKLSAGDLMEISQDKPFVGQSGNYDDDVGVKLILPSHNGDAFGSIFLSARPSCRGVVGIYMRKMEDSRGVVVGAVKNERLWWKIFRMICEPSEAAQ